MSGASGEPATEVAALAPDLETLARRLESVDYIVDEDHGDFDLKGPYFGFVARF